MGSKMLVKIDHIHGFRIAEYELDPETKISELKAKFAVDKCFYAERQKLTHATQAGPVLNEGTLASNNIKDGDILLFKDLGTQVSYRLVYIVEYLIPLLIHMVYYNFVFAQRKTTKQRIAFTIIMIHYMRRLIESTFIHKFSRSTMPAMNLLKNSMYYGLLGGVSLAVYLYDPMFLGNMRESDWLLVAGCTAAGIMNCLCHLHLAVGRESTERFQPYKFGFQFVSCANYFYELVFWVLFTVFTKCTTVAVFTLAGFIIMARWAKARHQKYQSEYPHYDKKILLPFCW